MRIPEGMCRLTQRGYATHAAVSLWDGILFVAGRVPRAGTYLRVCPPLVRLAGQRKCFRLLSSYLRDTTLVNKYFLLYIGHFHIIVPVRHCFYARVALNAII